MIMPKINPRARRTLTEERRKQILDAAAIVFAEKGFERATISDIAQHAKLAEGSIYNYFKNKGDLLVSIPRQAVQPTIEMMSARIAEPSDDVSPEQMLTTFVQNIIATFHQNGHVFRIMLSALSSMSQATREKYFNQVVLYALTLLESYFTKQIEQGVFRRDLNAATLARAFVGMLLPFVALREVLQVEDSANWNYDQLTQELISVFLRGVLAQPNSPITE